jgi:hypothetical protein
MARRMAKEKEFVQKGRVLHGTSEERTEQRDPSGADQNRRPQDDNARVFAAEVENAYETAAKRVPRRLQLPGMKCARVFENGLR